MENRFWLVLNTNYHFDSDDSARELLALLATTQGIAKPSHFDRNEPIRKALTAKSEADAIAMLCGSPTRKLGSVMLRSKDNTFSADIKWNSNKPLRWLLELTGDHFGSSEGWQDMISFFAKLCTQFPSIAGGAAPYDDWKAKHWRDIVSPGGAEGIEKVGFDFKGALTGTYWLTVLGPEAVAHFGKASLQALPIHQYIDLGAGGALLVLRPDPLAPALDARLAHDRAIAAALGQDYFFDIAAADRELKLLPGMVPGLGM
jgi:hypothetical protein